MFDKKSNLFSKKKVHPNSSFKSISKRLNQYIAQAGICSRRQADILIKNGLIEVNNEIIKEMGFQVTSKDKVVYKDKVLSAESKVYILLNKPRGFITTVKDEKNRRTVLDLLQNHFKERLYPIGRLDKNTTGLLLLTNDGEFSRQLSHPSSEVQKIYRVVLDKPLSESDFEAIIYKTFELEDGEIPFDGINRIEKNKNALDVSLHSGRNRIVRRVFEYLGYEVVRLDRIVYSILTKKGLKVGRWRELKDMEIIKLKHLKRIK